MEAKIFCCGVDVSLNTLDVCYQNNLGELFHLHVGNNNEGFKILLEHTGTNYHFVMEATGVSYIRLAFFLHHHGCTQSVVNALSIKCFIQMHGERNKSDKKDAAWICRYAIEQQTRSENMGANQAIQQSTAQPWSIAGSKQGHNQIDRKDAG